MRKLTMFGAVAVFVGTLALLLVSPPVTAGNSVNCDDLGDHITSANKTGANLVVTEDCLVDSGGVVGGNVTVTAGILRIGGGSIGKVEGNITVKGGEVEVNSDGRVEGNIRNPGGNGEVDINSNATVLGHVDCGGSGNVAGDATVAGKVRNC